MGLDMYLDKNIFVGGQFKYRDVQGTITYSYAKSMNDTGDRVRIELPIDSVSEIVLHAAQWRKANQIHKWFVDNVQQGEDNCGRYYVSREQLAELRNLCNQVLHALEKGDTDVATQLLPPQEGFFFGSYEIDDWYKEDVEYTATTLTKILAEPVADGEAFYYQASW